jgi:hypothetical protein
VDPDSIRVIASHHVSNEEVNSFASATSSRTAESKHRSCVRKSTSGGQALDDG